MVKENGFGSLSPAVNDDSNSDEYDNVVESNQALLKENRFKHNSGDSIESSKRFRLSKGKRHRSGEMSDPPKTVLYPPLPNPDEKSSQQKVTASDEISPKRKYLAVGVLFLINLLNYMDRFTIAGVLLSIQQYFQVGNAAAGLLQTVFIISYMLVAPLFGYLGDRYNRKIVMLVGMFVWSGSTLVASFVQDRSQFVLFLVLRGLVGIGEASYSTIAPTIIADLFVKTQRTRMLSIFFFAIPVGSGLGYIVGAAAAKAAGTWQWALRVTPGLGVVTMILLIFVIPNPKRGGSEAAPDVVEKTGIDMSRSSYLTDLKYVFCNRSFMCLTFGFTFMAFVVGSLTIWGPAYVAYSQIIYGNLDPCTDDGCEYAGVSFIFGLITCLAGFIGVWIGAESAKKLKEKGFKNADAHVCAFALIFASPLLFLGFLMAAYNLAAAWTFIFFADLSLCLTWTLVSDMTLYVTLPSRRSTAQAVQILVMHLFGDAGSPYLLGVISDLIASYMPDTYYTKYISLQYSIFMTLFASILGGCGFLFASLFLQHDKKKVEDFLSGKTSKSSSDSSSPSDSSDKSFELQKLEQGDAFAPSFKPETKTLITSNGDYFHNHHHRKTNKNNYDYKASEEVVESLLKLDGKESDL